MIILLGSTIDNNLALSIHVHFHSPLWIKQWKELHKKQDGIIIHTLWSSGPLFDIYTSNLINYPIEVINITNSTHILDFVDTYARSQSLLEKDSLIEKIEHEYMNRKFFQFVGATIARFSGSFIKIVSPEHLIDILLALHDLNPMNDSTFLAKQENIDDVNIMLASQDYNKKSHPPGKILFDDFKRVHLLEYKNLGNHKKLFSKMHQKLQKGKVNDIDDVKDYAKKKPVSVTAKVLRQFAALRYPDQKEHIALLLDKQLGEEPKNIIEEYLGFKPAQISPEAMTTTIEMSANQHSLFTMFKTSMHAEYKDDPDARPNGCCAIL